MMGVVRVVFEAAFIFLVSLFAGDNLCVVAGERLETRVE